MWDLCPIDGSRDEDIKIHGLPDYVVRKHHEMEDDEDEDIKIHGLPDYVVRKHHEMEDDEEDLFELDSSDED